MAWIYLTLAGVLEIGWPVGLKLSQSPSFRLQGLAIAAVCILASGYLLWLAQKSIPIGTAYAVWTGIGASGTFLVGVFVFGDQASLARTIGIAMIVGGVFLLKFGSTS